MIDPKSIFNITTHEEFETVALKVFAHQFENNLTYRSFCDLLYKHPADIKTVEDIPFLPISFFKTRTLISEGQSAQQIFTSSGTTGSITSKHHVVDLSVYEESFTKAFEMFYGDISEFAILGLLPNYLEREGSSLIYMVDHMIHKSPFKESGFYLYNHQALSDTLSELEERGIPTLLIGVSFALLDFVESYPQQLQHTIVMETGGMKGRRKELIRAELHQRLSQGFGLKTIHSEYGMTELLSQAYSKGHGLFTCPPWMKVLSRETEDPLSILHNNKSGGLNIIDLANYHSCSFIATQDLGKVQEDGSFEVIGRFDFSDVRGCNLMAL